MRARGTSVTISLQVKLYKDASCAGMRLHEASSRRRLVRPHCCTQTSESFFSSAWPQALKMTGRRDVVDCLVGISVCIERHVKRVVLSGWGSLSCAFARHLSLFYPTLTLERATFTGTWLQWPHWDVMLLTMPPTRKARGPDAAAGRSQQATHRRAGAVETSQRLTGSACYPAISWCIRRSLVGLVLRTHTMLPPSTQCKWPRTACQS